MSRCPLVLTGAGISAASGVPISAVNHSDTSFLTEVTNKSFEADPQKVWDQHLDLRRTLAECKPNAAHMALAEWAERVPHVVVTQNIDGLHEQSGHMKVVAYHGTIWQNRCTQCAEVRDDRTTRYDGLPAGECHPEDIERPNITWIGDGIFPTVKQFARLAAEMCDLVLVIGTSLEVAPFNTLPLFAARRGIPIIEINTASNGPFGNLFDLQLEAPAEDILPELLS